MCKPLNCSFALSCKYSLGLNFLSNSKFLAAVNDVNISSCSILNPNLINLLCSDFLDSLVVFVTKTSFNPAFLNLYDKTSLELGTLIIGCAYYCTLWPFMHMLYDL